MTGQETTCIALDRIIRRNHFIKISWSSPKYSLPENPGRGEPDAGQDAQVVENRASISVLLQQIDGSPDVIRFRRVSDSRANADGDLGA